MIIRKMHIDDLPACAQILQSVYNNELWQARWTQETAEAYLADIFDMKKFVGYVAEDQGELVGAIFAREKVWWNNSEIFVEEMFVRPDMQGKGVGSQLIRSTMTRAAELGFSGVVITGDPAYYHRFGFRPASDFGILYEDGGSFPAFMAAELKAGSLAGVSGRIRFAPAFSQLTEKDVLAFDAQFPKKERLKLPGQLR